MIDSIQGFNFQSHKETILDLHPGVNVVIGPSDSGKTGITSRLLDWVFNNKPSGAGMCSHWGGRTSGLVDLTEGYLIGRYREGDQNLYTLTDADGKEVEFKAFKQSVPDQIKEILNISGVNFQFQMDGPFLIGQSPPEVARYLNNTVNLNVIESATTNIRKRIRIESTEQDVANNDIDQLTIDLDSLKWIDEADAELSKLLTEKNQIERLKRERISLSVLIKDLVDLEKFRAQYQKITKYHMPCEDLLFELSEIEKAQSIWNQLAGMISGLERMQSELDKIGKISQHENQVDDLFSQLIDIDEIRKDFNKLWALTNEVRRDEIILDQTRELIQHEDMINDLFTQSGEINALKININKLKSFRSEISQMQFDLDSIRMERKELENSFDARMPDTCPLCERSCDCEH